MTGGDSPRHPETAQGRKTLPERRHRGSEGGGRDARRSLHVRYLCSRTAGRDDRARCARARCARPAARSPSPLRCAARPPLPARRRQQRRAPFSRAGSLSAVGGRAGAPSRRQGKPHVKRSEGARRLHQRGRGEGRGEEAGGRDAPGAAPARSRPGPGRAGGAEPGSAPCGERRAPRGAGHPPGLSRTSLLFLRERRHRRAPTGAGHPTGLLCTSLPSLRGATSTDGCWARSGAIPHLSALPAGGPVLFSRAPSAHPMPFACTAEGPPASPSSVSSELNIVVSSGCSIHMPAEFSVSQN